MKTPMFYTHVEYDRGRLVEVRERIVRIEYFRGLHGRWEPGNVTTERDCTSGGKRHEQYDFDWCLNTDDLRFFNAGSGPAEKKHRLSKFIGGREKIRAKLWTEPGWAFTVWVGKDCHGHEALIPAPKVHARALRTGIEIIARPLDLSAPGKKTRNPFDVALEMSHSTAWCDKCGGALCVDDDFSDGPCAHLRWSDQAEDFVERGK